MRDAQSKSHAAHALAYGGWILFVLSLAGLVLTVPPMCGLAYLYGWLNPTLHLPIAIGSTIGLAVSLALVFIGSWQGYRKPDERVCPACGYDLRGRHDAPACPECGRAL